MPDSGALPNRELPLPRVWVGDQGLETGGAGVFDHEAVAIANDTDYGLAAFVQTHDLQRALRLGERLVAGIVCVNGGATLSPTFPFGGIGISGFGREGGREGLDEFLRSKTLGIANVGRDS